MFEAIIHDPEHIHVAVPAFIARRLLPATVTTLFIFGWLGLWLVHVGTFGAAIFAALDIVVFTAALILCVRTLNQLDARGGEAAAALRRPGADLKGSTQEVEHRFRFLSDRIPQIIWTSQPDGKRSHEERQVDLMRENWRPSMAPIWLTN